ncbi:hypothetical protein BO94DRAFT_629229 [Aspergillus sclerotioniger CBS 115572]|uniref:BTB domain-containing protein n=1 Tax=Aspergillus sclerotioniger CBS 115572 TaxID=1450535 RepID=A0A317V0B8_9EURO|nr:hypothetical protein BO94DRAFT_629229 [Aspergillus sclerotioniger CBS 115572]PWY65630.1 hypothetical protein BO94DRAFT_629229 [Aspergillus sclerotioniger CBS 115572]
MAEEEDSKDNPIASLFLSSEGSDVSIICGDRIFPAHKKVLVKHSAYFKCACHEKWKILGEDKKNIVLNDKQPVLIEKMLEFLYTGSYSADTIGLTVPDLPNERLNTMIKDMDDPNGIVFPDDEIYAPCLHAMMYALAVYYEIPKLEEETVKNFKESFGQIRDQEGFQAAVIEVYYSTKKERKLRDCVIDMVLRNLEYLFRKEGEPQILDQEILDYVPEFCRDICIASMMANRGFQLEMVQYACTHMQMKEKVARVGRENTALRSELYQYKRSAGEFGKSVTRD